MLTSKTDDGATGAPDENRRSVVLMSLLLIGSLCAEIDIPVLGVGVQNLVVPAVSVAVLVVFRRSVPDIWIRHRRVLIAVGVFAGWALAASLLGIAPATSAYYWVKYAMLGLVFPAAMVLAADPGQFSRVLRVVHGFLIALALLGVFEALCPDNLVFLLFRTDSSLSIQPRIASLMAWPNQFGIVMGLGVILNESLGANRCLSRLPRWVITGLLLTQVAQSGSRNAWMVLCLGLVYAVVRKVLAPGRAALIAGVFLVILVILPVSARQTGLWEGKRVPVNVLLDREEAWTSSLSRPGESFSLRSKLWREAFGIIREQPVTGIGLEMYSRTSGRSVMGRPGFNAHNLVLNVGAELGLVGLVCLMWFGWTLARSRGSGGRLSEVALVMLLVGQMLDCFVHDATVMSLVWIFAAGLGVDREAG